MNRNSEIKDISDVGMVKLIGAAELLSAVISKWTSGLLSSWVKALIRGSELQPVTMKFTNFKQQRAYKLIYVRNTEKWKEMQQ